MKKLFLSLLFVSFFGTGFCGNRNFVWRTQWCWMTSTLQVLSQVEPLADFLKKKADAQELQDPLFKTLNDVFQNLLGFENNLTKKDELTTNEVVDPTSFYEAFNAHMAKSIVESMRLKNVEKSLLEKAVLDRLEELKLNKKTLLEFYESYKMLYKKMVLTHIELFLQDQNFQASSYGESFIKELETQPEGERPNFKFATFQRNVHDQKLWEKWKQEWDRRKSQTEIALRGKIDDSWNRVKLWKPEMGMSYQSDAHKFYTWIIGKLCEAFPEVNQLLSMKFLVERGGKVDYRSTYYFNRGDGDTFIATLKDILDKDSESNKKFNKEWHKGSDFIGLNGSNTKNFSLPVEYKFIDRDCELFGLVSVANYHYTAFLKHDDSWTHYDDSGRRVKPKIKLASREPGFVDSFQKAETIDEKQGVEKEYRAMIIFYRAINRKKALGSGQPSPLQSLAGSLKTLKSSLEKLKESLKSLVPA